MKFRILLCLLLCFRPSFLQIPESLLQSVLKCLTDVVNLETPSLASIAMQALGHVGLSVSLPPLLHGSSPGVLLCIMYLVNA